MSADALAELKEPGKLHVAVNMGNFLLVTGEAPNGDPDGVSPDMAKGIAEKLGVEAILHQYPMPGDVADAAAREEWDIGLIAIEPKRAEVIAFCDAYCEIVATYLVPEGSPLKSIEDVDQPGVRIAVSERAAYDLYLTRTLKHATLHRAQGLPGAVKLFVDEGLDALAGLVPGLIKNVEEIPGSSLLEGRFTTVRQAIGTLPGRPALHAFVEEYIADAKKSGRVAELIKKHGVTGKLEVAADE
jgi:polar amino acid transport system substrate-binding protein